MPIPEYMSWVPSRRRWTRMHNGKRFWVSCKALGVPATKEASVQAANAWWTAKQAELDTANRPAPRVPAPMEDIAAAALGAPSDLFGNVRQLLEQALLREEAARPIGNTAPQGDDEILLDAPDPDEGEQTRRREVMSLLEKLLFGPSAGVLPDDVAAQLPPARVHQIQSSAKGFLGESTEPPERTVKAKAAAWMKAQEEQVAAGIQAPDRCTNVRMCLAHFVAFLGETASVDIIDGDRLEAFYLHCLGKVAARRKDAKAGWSVSFAKETFAVARSWIRYLSEKGTIDPPRNIARPSFKFGSTDKKVLTWTVEEVQRVISQTHRQDQARLAADGQLRHDAN